MDLAYLRRGIVRAKIFEGWSGTLTNRTRLGKESDRGFEVVEPELQRHQDLECKGTSC